MLTAVFLVILITLHNFPCFFWFKLYCRHEYIQGSYHCKYKISLRQAPDGQSTISNRYFSRAFLSSEVLLRVKEYTMWTTKRTLSGYLLPLHKFHIWELFLCEFSTSLFTKCYLICRSRSLESCIILTKDKSNNCFNSHSKLFPR